MFARHAVPQSQHLRRAEEGAPAPDRSPGPMDSRQRVVEDGAQRGVHSVLYLRTCTIVIVQYLRPNAPRWIQYKHTIRTETKISLPFRQSETNISLPTVSQSSREITDISTADSDLIDTIEYYRHDDITSTNKSEPAGERCPGRRQMPSRTGDEDGVSLRNRPTADYDAGDKDGVSLRDLANSHPPVSRGCNEDRPHSNHFPLATGESLTTPSVALRKRNIQILTCGLQRHYNPTRDLRTLPVIPD